MTVEEAVLRQIYNYLKPDRRRLSISLIHSAHKDHPYSGAQRLRELRKNGVVVYRYNSVPLGHYDFTGTKKSVIKRYLKQKYGVKV